MLLLVAAAAVEAVVVGKHAKTCDYNGLNISYKLKKKI
jgi:hypothetical protein